MAISYGVAVPKGKTVKQRRAKSKREDAKQLQAFRDAVWEREQNKVFVFLYPACHGDCQHCGAPVMRVEGFLMTGEVHHRISRRHKATRYDPDNGVLLCNHLVNNCHEKAERGLIDV